MLNLLEDSRFDGGRDSVVAAGMVLKEVWFTRPSEFFFNDSRPAAARLSMGNSEISSFVELNTARIHNQIYNFRHWHGYSGIGVSSFVGGMGDLGNS